MDREYRAPRGTLDILPADQPYWSFVQAAIERLCARFGYDFIETPIFEDASLFTRGVGDVTDIVQKEMYVFQDRGGQELALRPEGTAPICRAYLQHGMHSLPQPVRLWYLAPNFRYDRPQAGRYREHHQFGAEAIGEAGAGVDAEIIELLWRLYEDLGLTGLTLNLNSIGDPNCRPAYLEVLRDYYRDKLHHVCGDCRVRFERNPLRLLDCKVPGCQPVIAKAPPITDYLCDECGKHFADLKSYLEAVGIPYLLNPRLVRGLDYYTRTVFEVQPQEEGGQSAIGGGGRYDGLIELLGGRPTPGIGFGTGLERIILNLKRQEVLVPQPEGTQVLVAYTTPAARVEAFRLASDLRRAGVPATASAGERSLKAQMRHADGIGARYAAIIGERELAEGMVTLKRLDTGEQELVSIRDMAGRSFRD
ncbi:MAG TPA: histidine--tRNA ligase [Dehalococcoidia bacterium]|nr:histidine--tRNA ligase [Dehalococcoidia bacterium]